MEKVMIDYLEVRKMMEVFRNSYLDSAKDEDIHGFCIQQAKTTEELIKLLDKFADMNGVKCNNI